MMHPLFANIMVFHTLTFRKLIGMLGFYSKDFFTSQISSARIKKLNSICRYYEAKQIPNFLLAAPVLSTLGLASLRHAKSYVRLIKSTTPLHKDKLTDRHCSLQRRSIFEMKAITYENILELSLACHGLFLTLFCLYFIHVQVRWVVESIKLRNYS